MEEPGISHPLQQEPPLLFGPDHVTRGYYELEELQRGFTLTALREHQDAVALWYRGLTLYRSGMMGTWEYPGRQQRGNRVTAWGIQTKLLGLGIGSAKASLDLLLAGHYSMAYAGIRHMLESTLQVLYLAACPLESPMWFGKPGYCARELINANKKPPKFVPPNSMQMVEQLTKYVPQWGDGLKVVYDSWALMSRGAHPASEGMRQTEPESDTFHVIGPTYVEDLCLTGFDHGLSAVNRQLHALNILKPQSEDWNAQHDALTEAMAKWRQETANKLGITDFTAPEEENL